MCIFSFLLTLLLLACALLLRVIFFCSLFLFSCLLASAQLRVNSLASCSLACGMVCLRVCAFVVRAVCVYLCMCACVCVPVCPSACLRGVSFSRVCAGGAHRKRVPDAMGEPPEHPHQQAALELARGGGPARSGQTVPVPPLGSHCGGPWGLCVFFFLSSCCHCSPSRTSHRHQRCPLLCRRTAQPCSACSGTSAA